MRMRLQTILHTLKSMTLFALAIFLYLLMLWGLSAITPVNSENTDQHITIAIGWVVLLASWLISVKTWKMLNAQVFSFALGVLYVLFSIVLFVDGAFLMLFDELLSGACMVLFSIVILLYTIKVRRYVSAKYSTRQSTARRAMSSTRSMPTL